MGKGKVEYPFFGYSDPAVMAGFFFAVGPSGNVPGAGMRKSAVISWILGYDGVIALILTNNPR
jgi:hypothetical protein